ncbi:phosphocholine-specific phospholipase C [Variovorax arabinosiphilus]|uniref:phosphocholine-specific phospholipase C n=1 Tax=Variovorax arabinosiphilus TaxID=3053498 RepID=UPI0025788B4A|nr:MULTISPECIES: phospholipase C, phosphocholine-specific [unclassified Variovorax]MDM0122816.1 phospholipase C, phosphocholine-specific [Variovorax sp. J2L1-78]MDM0132188.1 phospholipase C, phosphocholine-specific [Variovorax sp. J2L1-63]MDM0235579.1 phospholipase C, phosphocholine-specific [Variovorax sp. J2R1-6]
MNHLPRRNFLRKSAGAIGAASALTMLPPSIRKALAVEAAVDTGTLQDVKHVVILMQENRSFDHYFGTLKGVRGFGDRFPIPLASGKSVWYESDGTREITPFHLDMTQMNAIKSDTTSHTFPDMQAAWSQGQYGYWPKFKIDLVTGKNTGHSMGYFKRQEIPFQFALAEAFTLCDQYHCSVLSGTDPNRVAFWSGSAFDPTVRAQGLNNTDATSEPNNVRCWVVKNWKPGNWPVPGYTYLSNALTWPTIPDVLQKAGVSWRIYQDPNNNWTGAMNGCLAFESFRTAPPGSPIYANGMSAWSLTDLANDVKNNTLPAVSWVLPSQAQSEHASGSSPASGADFTQQVLEALVANPEVWSKTVLFVTFDENDGFFDHVPPPAVPSYNLDGSLAGKSTLDVNGMYFDTQNNVYVDEFLSAYIGKPTTSKYLDDRDTITGKLRPFGMGPRVPMYVISPWSKGGWVNSQVSDHASVGMFLEKRFGITVPAISPWHRAVSGDLTSAFDFVSPNDPAVPTLPATRQYQTIETQQLALPAAVAPAVLPTFAQEVGTRPSRALPYELHTSARVEPRGLLQLVFANTGMQGAVFHVYDKLHLERIPRRYTVEAGKTLNDFWDTAATDSGKYDLWVYSTNGYVRSFSGDALAHGTAAFKPEVQVCYEPVGGQIYVKLHNTGSAGGRVTVTPNAYRTDGPWPLEVAAGATGTLHWKLDDSGQWYDFTVTGEKFERRFAGRVETGRHSVSDPAMALGLAS